MNRDIKQVNTTDSIPYIKHQRHYSFWNYKFTDNLNENPLKCRTLSFNNTIGHYCKNAKSIHLKIMSNNKHKLYSSMQIPKFNNFKLNDINKKSCFAKLNNSHSITKIFIDSASTTNNKPIQTTTLNNINHSKKKIMMKQTDIFSNKKPIKYRIKKNDLYSLKQENTLPTTQMNMNGAIININHNINHKIQINVNKEDYNGKDNYNDSGMLFAPQRVIFKNHTMNFKNIKITRQKLLNNNKTSDNNVILIENADNNNNKENNEKKDENKPMTIIEEDICAVSRLNSVKSKTSNEVFKVLKGASSQSSINNQTISFDLSNDDLENNTLSKGFNQTKKTKQIKSFNKEDFKQFCIDMNKKLTLFK